MPETTVHIFIGSASDLKIVKESGMFKDLQAVGVEFKIHNCSAHRNLKDLIEFCEMALAEGGRIFIGIAGLAAALPGALAAITDQIWPVIGVPLDEDGVKACLQMPPGVPVLTSGAGEVADTQNVRVKAALRKAAHSACQILAVGDKQVELRLRAWVQAQKEAKPPGYDINPEL